MCVGGALRIHNDENVDNSCLLVVGELRIYWLHISSVIDRLRLRDKTLGAWYEFTRSLLDSVVRC